MKYEPGQRVQMQTTARDYWHEGWVCEDRVDGIVIMPVDDHMSFLFDRALVRPHLEDHPDSKAVDRFAQAMKERLYEARRKGRGDWENPDDCTDDLLAKLLLNNTVTGDPIDVANFAMMLFRRKAKPEVLSHAARDFQERMAAPIREELEDIKQLCIEAGCTDPGDEYAVSAMCMVEELRQRTVCTTPYHYIDDVPAADIEAFVAFCKENDLDRMFRDEGLNSVWNALSRNIEGLL